MSTKVSTKVETWGCVCVCVRSCFNDLFYFSCDLCVTFFIRYIQSLKLFKLTQMSWLCQQNHTRVGSGADLWPFSHPARPHTKQTRHVSQHKEGRFIERFMVYIGHSSRRCTFNNFPLTSGDQHTILFCAHRAAFRSRFSRVVTKKKTQHISGLLAS